MTRILLYTTQFCGYCRAAKQLLRGKALDFEEIDVAFDADKRAKMIERATTGDCGVLRAGAEAA
jgi:glutaredoxin 3